MKLMTLVMGLTLALAVTGCGEVPTKSDPKITHVLLDKGERKLYLLQNGEVVRKYRVGLGFAPEGDKKYEGDGRTPEGNYIIDRRNPNSAFFLSIGINYPNRQDVAEARSLGKSPGGDIFIHGEPNRGTRSNFGRGDPDWTAGCIAVNNRQMREIYRLVKNGTPIRITP